MVNIPAHRKTGRRAWEAFIKAHKSSTSTHTQPRLPRAQSTGAALCTHSPFSASPRALPCACSSSAKDKWGEGREMRAVPGRSCCQQGWGTKAPRALGHSRSNLTLGDLHCPPMSSPFLGETAMPGIHGLLRVCHRAHDSHVSGLAAEVLRDTAPLLGHTVHARISSTPTTAALDLPAASHQEFILAVPYIPAPGIPLPCAYLLSPGTALSLDSD